MALLPTCSAWLRVGAPVSASSLGSSGIVSVPFRSKLVLAPEMASLNWHWLLMTPNKFDRMVVNVADESLKQSGEKSASNRLRLSVLPARIVAPIHTVAGERVCTPPPVR